ncbi:MAG TPA: hypothetical protein VMV69_05310 [Pirellulales bacterium]|nr:hypothetical protein [Pirellulales bacterium]
MLDALDQNLDGLDLGGVRLVGRLARPQTKGLSQRVASVERGQLRRAAGAAGQVGLERLGLVGR